MIRYDVITRNSNDSKNGAAAKRTHATDTTVGSNGSLPADDGSEQRRGGRLPLVLRLLLALALLCVIAVACLCCLYLLDYVMLVFDPLTKLLGKR